MAVYTVIGAYDGDELLVIGAVEGEHQLLGETRLFHGLEAWADHIEASDAQAACVKAAGR